MQSELLQKIERNAAQGNPVSKDLNPPEVMLHYMLMGLYASYHAGKLTKEEGHEYKLQIYTTYNKLLAEYNQFITICKEYQKRLREGYSMRRESNASIKSDIIAV